MFEKELKEVNASFLLGYYCLRVSHGSTIFSS